MLDPLILASMIFTIVVLGMIGGFILLYPIARLAGQALQIWIENRSTAGDAGAALLEVRTELERLHGQIERVAEQQEFVERALSRETPGAMG
ncbi:MAG: hypothetical protein PVF05_06890 [Gemmatimonadales bacterium]|jgi:hypothetical protein